MSPRVLVRGVGDVGSAIGHRLHRVGCEVVLHDEPMPTHPRRGMSFTDALYDGQATLEGVLGIKSQSVDEALSMARSRVCIALCIAAFDSLLDALRPDALVDARMRKRDTPETLIGLAPLAIGVGPGFEAGSNCHCVIESQWGTQLGEVLTSGSAAALGGSVRAIEGHGAERVIYAPHGGLFVTAYRIGAFVDCGVRVATIDGTELCAPMAGHLRGLTRSGVWVPAKTKVLEIDPRATPQFCFGLGERPLKIANGVLRALAGAGFLSASGE